MYATSSLRLVDAKFWKDKFRDAVLIMIGFGALITPDGSGITMWFIVLPMVLLYVVGMHVIIQRERKHLLETSTLMLKG